VPDPKLLYAVTAIVVVGLAAWVAFVLKNAKVAWAEGKAAESNSRSEPKPESEPKPAIDSKSEPQKNDDASE
jgi:hypothetical protein